MLYLAAARTALPVKGTRRSALESAASEDKECKEWRSRLLPNAVADYLGHRAISSSLCYDKGSSRGEADVIWSMNILEEIPELCRRRHTPEFATNQELQGQLRRIKQLADKNANTFAGILCDYIRERIFQG
jgi:hypothetical protein